MTIMKRITIIVLLAIALTATAQRTPSMGWSSWNTFALDINEQLIRQQADAMHQCGLQEAGYFIINIDNCYWQGRAVRATTPSGYGTTAAGCPISMTSNWINHPKIIK